MLSSILITNESINTISGAELARPENNGPQRLQTTSLWRTFRMTLQTLHYDWLNSFD